MANEKIISISTDDSGVYALTNQGKYGHKLTTSNKALAAMKAKLKM